MSNSTVTQIKNIQNLIRPQASAMGKLKTGILKASIAGAIMTAPLAAYACQIPKSYYSNVFCTASSQYFLALKDSGQPVALINTSGRRVADLTRYNGIDVTKLKGGLVPVQRYGKVGYINMSGREVIPPIYDIITNDSQTNGWARAVNNNRIVVKKGGKFGVIDTNNKVVVPFSASYQTIGDYNGNLASIRRNNQTQWINLKGQITQGPQPAKAPVMAKVVTQPKPQYQESPRITSIPAANVNRTVRRVDTERNANQALGIPVVSSGIGASTYPAVTTSNKITVLNSNRSTTTGLPSDVATPITPAQPGPIYGSSQPATTISTNATIRPIQSSPASGVTPATVASAEIITVDQKPRPSPMNREVWQPEERDGKWGFVNRTGVPMITFTFNQVTPFSEGLAGVRMQDKWGFINLAGELVIPFDFSESVVRRGNGATYKGVQPFVFTGGKAWVANMPNGAQMCIDQEGRYVGC